MKVGWLTDETSMVGGAELTQAEFRAAAPEGVEVVDCRVDEWIPSLDAYAIHNCVTYPVDYLQELTRHRVVKYWNDVGPHLHPGVREWLAENATPVCCSPVQAEYMGLEDVRLIPPPVDLSRFEAAAAEANGHRAGNVCVASWRNYGKGPNRVIEWAEANKTDIAFYGGGPLAPAGSQEVPYSVMPALLAQFERFVFLPTVIEPFGRLVAEAWAAGCEVVTNSLVGARHWLDNDPDAIGRAAADFWAVVLDA
jgi:glycosyltransferase involved in cell wall biosynthesis